METKHCNTCGRTLPLSAFVWVRKTDKPYFRCKECHKQKNKEQYLSKRDEYLAYRKRYHAENREREVTRDRAARLLRKIKVWEHYGSGAVACVCCGVTEIEFLTLDHIAADGADHRRLLRQKGVGGYATGWFIYKWLIDNGFPDGYQTLCFNCNVGKHRTKVNKCPHELARYALTR